MTTKTFEKQPHKHPLFMSVKKKICPLTFGEHYGFAECQMDRCAWWDSELKACVIHTIARKLSETTKE